MLEIKQLNFDIRWGGMSSSSHVVSVRSILAKQVL